MTAGPEEIAVAVARLREGGLVAFPTETVYGLGADALSAEAVAGVFAAKGRPASNPLIVHVSGEEMARTVVADWPEDARRLAAAFWPGPLTLVLPKSARVPDVVTAGGATVAVRCPDHPITLALLEAYGGPLVGPSANPSGGVSPTIAAHVRESLPGVDILVLDGGPCRGGIESTVLLLGDRPRVLRPGLIGSEDLSIALGRPVSDATTAKDTGPALSPGVLGAHYAPRARTVLFEGDLSVPEGTAVVLTMGPGRSFEGGRRIEMPVEPHAYAARLYAALREADAAGPELIAIEAPPHSGPVWEAVWDRLRRATASGEESGPT